MIYIFCLFFSFNYLVSQAENRVNAALEIFAGASNIDGTSSQELKIQMEVIDPLNRRLSEIPNSSYNIESISDIEGDVETEGPEELEIRIWGEDVIKGKYTIVVEAIDDVVYEADIRSFSFGGYDYPPILLEGKLLKGNKVNYILDFDPTPGAPPPVLTKIVTFQTLRDDIEVAYKLNQLGDERFKDSLVRMINIAEMIYNKCVKIDDKLKDKTKDEKIKTRCYKPVIAILRLIMKRLEVINKLCDNKTECKPRCKIKAECDEEEVFNEFDTKYRKDKDFKEFYDKWLTDEYHKHKKNCKRYVTDEALEIISTDINWLIKSFGTDIWDDYKTNHKPYIPDKYRQFFK